MILTELLYDGQLIRHYSDMGYDLLQNETGQIYSEAIDTIPCRFTYTEIVSTESEEEITSEELLAMIEEVL